MFNKYDLLVESYTLDKTYAINVSLMPKQPTSISFYFVEV